MKRNKSLLNSETNVRFELLLKLCEDYFGPYRIAGSHHIFKTPWPGDPRINLQKDGKMAKPYQVKQVRLAIEKWEEFYEKQNKKTT